MYYNTTGQTGTDLEECRRRNKRQKAEIYAFFKTHPTLAFGPSQVWKQVNPAWPLTSVRRAITDLTADGFLVKRTDIKVTGAYGHPEYCWQIDNKGENER